MVAVTLVLGVAGLAAGYYVHGFFSPAVVLLVLIEAAALWWRRRHPVPVLAVIFAGQVAQLALGLPSDPSGPALVFAVYAVSVYDRTTARLWVAGAAIALIIVGVALIVIGAFPGGREILIPVGATSLVGWVIGAYIRSRRDFLADLVARHEQAREQATEDERLRIARELHDVVAHNVSVIAIQAGAARVSGNGGAEALLSIETTARDTLAELNRLLGVLRKDPAAPNRNPQPGLDQLDVLVKPAREAGLDVTMKTVGKPRPLPAALDLSAFRIVQEAITNVLKHAQASRVEVIVDYQPDALALTISDNGGGPSDDQGASAGHGLIGMRERVELFGGELGTGSSSLGGFTVRARLPIS